MKKENVEVQEDDGVERAFMVEGVQTEDSVKLMLDQGFETTKDSIEKIRKDIEIERLKLLDERTELEIKEANLKREEELFEQKKEEHPERDPDKVKMTRRNPDKKRKRSVAEVKPKETARHRV